MGYDSIDPFIYIFSVDVLDMRQSVPNDTFVDCFLSNDCQLNFADFIPFFLIFRLISFIFFSFFGGGSFSLNFQSVFEQRFSQWYSKDKKDFLSSIDDTHTIWIVSFLGYNFFLFATVSFEHKTIEKKNTIEYVQSLLSLFKILFSFRLFARDFNLCLIQKRCRWSRSTTSLRVFLSLYCFVFSLPTRAIQCLYIINNTCMTESISLGLILLFPIVHMTQDFSICFPVCVCR